MPAPAESATLLLKLYELRRDPVLREARDWFTARFHPDTIEDFVALLRSEHNPKIRMVIGYWDMAATLVGHGAIDEAMFQDANPELLAAYCKLHPLLGALRELNGDPGYLRHLERVALGYPNAEERLAALRARLRTLAAP